MPGPQKTGFGISGGVEGTMIAVRREPLLYRTSNQQYRDTGSSRQALEFLRLLGRCDADLVERDATFIQKFSGVIAKSAAIGRGVELDRGAFDRNLQRVGFCCVCRWSCVEVLFLYVLRTGRRRRFCVVDPAFFVQPAILLAVRGERRRQRETGEEKPDWQARV